MQTHYPIRRADGREFETLEEALAAISKEPYGWWLAGANRHWHGGIHISKVSSPLSVLNAEEGDKAVPLQCMAEGEVVAWRINKDYRVVPYENKSLHYSSTFVLVRSVHKPLEDKPKSWLTFYTLYMHLAPVSEFPRLEMYHVTAKGAGLRMRSYTGHETPDQPVSTVIKGNLKKNDKFQVLRRMFFLNDGVRQAFGLAKSIVNGKPSGEFYWAALDPLLVTLDGEQYGCMPEWMQKACEKGDFDSVIIPDAPISIASGSAVGFLARDDVPLGQGKTDTDWLAHIEVISNDKNMPEFLNNPEKAKTGRAFVKIAENAQFYRRTDEDNDTQFTPIEGEVATVETGKILRWEKIESHKIGEEKYWVEIESGIWLNQDGAPKLTQHDLAALNFMAIKQAPVEDFKYTLVEEWVGKAFRFFHKQYTQGSNLAGGEGNTVYNRLADVIDRNKDGVISEEEIGYYKDSLFRGLHNSDSDVPDLLRRLIVEHDSEWHGGSEHARWQGFYTPYNISEQPYLKQWRNDVKWMEDVAPFKEGKPVWHFHPLEFLEFLKTTQKCANLHWGKLVEDIHGQEKGCKFRKKVVEICAELWGDKDKYDYANTLMSCMAVETSKTFSSSVIKLLPMYDAQGNVQLNSKGKVKRSYQAVSKEALIADPSIAKTTGVGLIQFTGVAVEQINIIHGLNVTKQQLALMDELEQLDYVKLYFTANNDLLKSMKGPEDVYLFIFCPEGVGRDGDYVLYSRSKDAKDKVSHYEKNSSLDTSINGNDGNNDGKIQRSELLSRLNKLTEEGKKHINLCTCSGETAKPVEMTNEPSGRQWVNRFPTSSDINELTPAFNSAVQNFISAIERAGGRVRVAATHRPSERAHLMHYAWRIAREAFDPAAVPAKEGVNIDWTHKGDSKAALSAAREMVAGYQIVFRPSLTSRHIERRAIDMNITGIMGHVIEKADGQQITIRSNSDLFAVGRSWGVVKLISDPPHWSDDGR